MTDDPEGPVHYQISVTGRQAASFFLVLLVSLGVAFFFGMKAGQAASRGSDSPGKPPAVAEAAGPAAAGPADAEARKPAAPAPEAGEKKLGFDDGPPREADVASTAKTAERTAEKAPEKAAEKKAPEPARAPEAAAAAPAAAPPAKKEAPKKEAKKETAGPFFVQLMATKEPEAADALVKKLKDAGGFRSPDVSPVPGKTGTFRVRIGPYPDRASAEKAVARLKKEKRSADPTIVKADKP